LAFLVAGVARESSQAVNRQIPRCGQTQAPGIEPFGGTQPFPPRRGAILASMARPRGSSLSLPETLRPLVDQLVALDDAERTAVIEAASRRAGMRLRGGPVSWESVHKAQGCVAIGGNAVEDTEALYDG
jgi:hypothetical protein